MDAKVWNFFLPDSGCHSIVVEHIGSEHQTILIDGEYLKASGVQRSVFTGPSDSLCELRKQNGWQLLVNGVQVEDYTPGRRQSRDESLREVKGRPDGSYLIQTKLDTSALQMHIVRKFVFWVQGRLMEVQLAHHDWIWQVVLNNVIVDRVTHKIADNIGWSKFEVPVLDGTLPAEVSMTWSKSGGLWHYELQVAGIHVPASWTRVMGEACLPADPPVIPCAGRPDVLPSSLEGSDGELRIWPSAEEAVEDEIRSREGPQTPDDPAGAVMFLPQGVSYDSSTGAFQANIRAQTGRFVFLGEFATAEEAQQKYLRAIPVYCPDKAVAPDIPM